MKRRVQVNHQQAANFRASGEMTLATINDSVAYSCLTIRLTDTRTRTRSRPKMSSANARRRNPVRF